MSILDNITLCDFCQNLITHLYTIRCRHIVVDCDQDEKQDCGIQNFRSYISDTAKYSSNMSSDSVSSHQFQDFAVNPKSIFMPAQGLSILFSELLLGHIRNLDKAAFVPVYPQQTYRNTTTNTGESDLLQQDFLSLVSLLQHRSSILSEDRT
uniref:Uncharacterized protein n=1 Tax=Setaria digitata TaxID=48799 RepID=A0A915PWL3_9BILA